MVRARRQRQQRSRRRANYGIVYQFFFKLSKAIFKLYKLAEYGTRANVTVAA